jgi:hypothetical protein
MGNYDSVEVVVKSDDIQRLIDLRKYRGIEMSLFEQLWWRFMPGEVITVRWPRGDVLVNHDDARWQDMGGAVWVNLGFSADPNDHYRSELEQKCGRQGWDWNWRLFGDNALEDRLTIKIRQKHARWATYFSMKWS